ncbi:hypothetical protein MXD62_19590 [Frankia sp. Mgl5]|uniref:hypothetical protein n=1 Tax=Frankia sp. Mgl5 TaxID=2933793 RepID=UPI00200BF677|nr:hypothetical protein [Frankia sp. Mgl5]MCK9929356.1 hypothetical protein [Frankia sp. Mgl5]
MTDQTQTSNPATAAAPRDVTATVTVAGSFAANYAHVGLAAAVATIASEIDVIDAAIEMHRREPASEPYGQALAREIIAELDAHDLAHQVASRTADYLHVMEQERARQQAADGLDDQDGPVTRAALYAAHTPWPFITVWATDGDRWWQVAYDGDVDGIGWTEVPVPDDKGLLRIPGWVEIPQATTDDTTTRAELERAWMACPVIHAELPCDTCGWPGADALAASEEQTSA